MAQAWVSCQRLKVLLVMGMARAQAGSRAQGEEKGWGTEQTTEETPVIYLRQTPSSTRAMKQEGQHEGRFQGADLPGECPDAVRGFPEAPRAVLGDNSTDSNHISCSSTRGRGTANHLQRRDDLCTSSGNYVFSEPLTLPGHHSLFLQTPQIPSQICSSAPA